MERSVRLRFPRATSELSSEDAGRLTITARTDAEALLFDLG